VKAQRQVRENLVYWPVSSTHIPPIIKAMPDSSQSKQELANRWKQHMLAIACDRDKNAYKALYIYFAPKIKSFFQQHASESRADEMTHEVFLRVWQKADSYQAGKAQVSTWIFTIARNLKIDILRRKKIIEVDESQSEELAAYDNVNEKLDISRQKIKLSALFKQLNHEQKNVILKVYFEDKSHQVTANELDLSLGVVKSRVRSALKILRHHMGGEKS